MSRAGAILERLDWLNEVAEFNAEVRVRPEDTLIKNQTMPDGIVPQCPTCGRDVIPGVLTPSIVQCPGCMTDIDLANGMYKYRTLSGNAVAADGVKRTGYYGSEV